MEFRNLTAWETPPVKIGLFGMDTFWPQFGG
jgi:hypothetical protein